MLKDFVYFDEEMVLKFASQLDGGQRARTTEKQSRRRRGGLSISAKGVGVNGSKESGEDRELEITDDPFAAFDRLLKAGEERPDELSWIDVNDPETDLAGVGRGFTITGEADFVIPPFSRILGSREQLQGLANLASVMSNLAPLIGREGLGSNLDMAQVEGVSKLAESIGDQISVIGSFAESDWTVAGTLGGVADIDDIDGPLVFVGKVVEIVPAGSYKSLLTLPGMTLLTRDQRRKMQQAPKEGDEGNWISGPGAVLKFLAIYR